MGNEESNFFQDRKEIKTQPWMSQDVSLDGDFLNQIGKERRQIDEDKEENSNNYSFQQQTQQKIKSRENSYQQDYSPFFLNKKQIMVPKKNLKHPKNSIRFLVRLALKYIKQNQDEYPPEIFDLVMEKCIELRKWKSLKKKNIYLMKHLTFILNDSNTFSEKGVRINKKVFSKVLSTRALEQIQDPASQIQFNKHEYLRVCKIYSLRCRNTQLILRNQSK